MGMADRIKERRTALKLTQEELATKLGLQKSAIAKYENGRVENIKRSVILKMAKILECSPVYLLDLEDDEDMNAVYFDMMLNEALIVLGKEYFVRPMPTDSHHEQCFVIHNNKTNDEIIWSESDIVRNYENAIRNNSTVSASDIVSPIWSKSNILPITTKRFPVLSSVACGKPILMQQDLELYVDAATEIKADFVLIAKGDSMTGARIHDGDYVFIRQQPTVENGEIAAVGIGDEATLKRVYWYANKSVLVLRAENPEYTDMEFTGESLNDVQIFGKAVAFQSDVR